MDLKGKSFEFYQKILIEKAPDPIDVIWQNLGRDSGSRKRRIFSIFAYSFMLSSVNFGLILLLDFVQVNK